MKTNFWLTISGRGSVRVTKSPPSKRIDEVSLHMKLDLPDALFDKPQLQAHIAVPEEAVQTTQVTTEVLNNISDAIRTSTGLDMVVRVVEPEVEDEG